MRRLTPILALLALTRAAVASEYQIAIGTTIIKVASASATRASLCVKALNANTGTVYCRHNDSNVSSTSGWELTSKEGYCWTIGTTVQDPLYCVGTNSADKVCVEDAYR